MPRVPAHLDGSERGREFVLGAWGFIKHAVAGAHMSLPRIFPDAKGNVVYRRFLF